MLKKLHHSVYNLDTNKPNHSFLNLNMMKKTYLLFVLFTLLYSPCVEKKCLVCFHDLIKQIGNETWKDQYDKIHQKGLLPDNVNSYIQMSNRLFASKTHNYNNIPNYLQEPHYIRVGENVKDDLQTIGIANVDGLTFIQVQQVLVDRKPENVLIVNGQNSIGVIKRLNLNQQDSLITSPFTLSRMTLST